MNTGDDIAAVRRRTNEMLRDALHDTGDPATYFWGAAERLREAVQTSQALDYVLHLRQRGDLPDEDA